MAAPNMARLARAHAPPSFPDFLVGPLFEATFLGGKRLQTSGRVVSAFILVFVIACMLGRYAPQSRWFGKGERQKKRGSAPGIPSFRQSWRVGLESHARGLVRLAGPQTCFEY